MKLAESGPHAYSHRAPYPMNIVQLSMLTVA